MYDKKEPMHTLKKGASTITTNVAKTEEHEARRGRKGFLKRYLAHTRRLRPL